MREISDHERRRRLLVRHRLTAATRAATVEEITEVSGIGPRTAEAIVAALAAKPAEPAVDPTTGEVLSA